jgi:hypothetical protein
MNQFRAWLRVSNQPPTFEKWRTSAGITSNTTTTVGTSSMRARLACFSVIPGNTWVLRP